MQKRPELMILIAVLAALVASIIVTAVSCSMLDGAVQEAVHNGTPGYNSIIEDIEGHGGNDLLDELLGGNGGDNPDGNTNGNDDAEGAPDGNGGAENAPDGSNGLHGGYSDKDVPASMEIETPELTDDLQACINNELQVFAGSDYSVTVTDLTKGDVAKPELKNGRVLGQVSGKATITMKDGKSETVDYTSYYYADDPTATKITWYIYAYDLGSYSLFPKGFENASGDPMYVRGLIQGDGSSLNGLLGRNGSNESTNA